MVVRVALLFVLLSAALVVPASADGLRPVSSLDRTMLVENQRQEAWAQETFYQGKRCKFNNAETVIVAAAWVFTIIGGAILTPLACKMDWFE